MTTKEARTTKSTERHAHNTGSSDDHHEEHEVHEGVRRSDDLAATASLRCNDESDPTFVIFATFVVSEQNHFVIFAAFVVSEQNHFVTFAAFVVSEQNHFVTFADFVVF